MADFAIAYAPLKEFEGGWSNDPADRGGETYAGIARNFFPRWPGWKIVDACKKEGGTRNLSRRLAANAELQDLVADWYRAEWFDALGLGSLEQKLANEIFEQSVNLGKAGCGKKVQQICNAHNYNSRTKKPWFTDLKVDGAIGPRTLAALKILVAEKTTVLNLVHALNCMQGAHYIDLAARKASQRVFINGWLKRTFDPD